MRGGPPRCIAQIIVAAIVGLAGVQAQGQGTDNPPTLSATERRIAAAVDQRNAQALALLERVVNINSGTMNFEGVRKVGDAFRTELDALGFSTMRDMRAHGIDMLTIGQYLQPSQDHLPVLRYVHPDTFAAFEREAYAMGFRHAAVGALVRSSYHADAQAEDVLAARV